ncbi:MAG: HupE/UreJ family protein [Nitrosomonadales bacterium]|nr:HupE/UreJ family protein [Nitrosomonadales bacterium]
MNRKILSRAVTIVLGTLLPSLAYAHVGIGDASGFTHGFTHPFSGLDHVCAMLAVGLWAAQSGGRSVWVVPLSFVGVMAVGGMLPALGIALPFVEQGIVLSVLLLGVLIATAIRMPLWLSCGMVGLFALWHGHAHGAEMPALVSGMSYAVGFVLTTALLHIAGIAFGLGMQRLTREHAIRFAGTGIALCGVYLIAA